MITTNYYTKDKYEEWDNFIEKSRNGTFMHTRKFLNYHPKGRFLDESLMFYKKKKLIAVFPCAQRITKNFDWFYTNSSISHPGASYGGIIISKECKTSDIKEIISAIKAYTGQLQIKMPPRIYNKYPCDEIDYILHEQGFKVIKRELSSCIDLREFDESYMVKNTRVANKQAKKRGVSVELSDDIERFWEIETDNLKKHKVKPTHTLEEIKRLMKSFPNKIKLFVAKHKNKIIGGALIFITNNVVHTQYLGIDYKYEKYRPLNTIIDFLIKYYKNKNYLSFGVSTPNGEYINWGLIKFKEGFGARGIIRETWKYDCLR